MLQGQVYAHAVPTKDVHSDISGPITHTRTPYQYFSDTGVWMVCRIFQDSRKYLEVTRNIGSWSFKAPRSVFFLGSYCISVSSQGLVAVHCVIFWLCFFEIGFVGLAMLCSLLQLIFVKFAVASWV